MDKSLIDSLAGEVLPTSSNSVSSTTPRHQYSQCFAKKQMVSVLRESIRNKEQQRLKSQYSRKIKNKQNQLDQLSKKCIQLEKQIKNITKIKKIINTEKDQIQEKNNNYQLQIEALNNQIKNNEEQNKKYKIELEKVKKEDQMQRKQLSILKEKYDNLCKEHKVQMRRINQTYQSNRLQLQAKFSVKQKQHQKIEAILEQKKLQFEQALTIRDQELAYLKQCNKELEEKNGKLQCQLQKQQNQKINEYQIYSEEIKCISNKMQEQQIKYHTFVQKISQTVQCFKQQLSLKSEDQDIFKQLQQFKQELMGRQQCKHFQQKIARLSLQVACKQRTQKELKSRIQILKDELSFVKAQLHNNSNFAAIIKSQMSGDSKITAAASKTEDNKLLTKTIQSSVPQKHQEEKQNIANANKQFLLSQQLSLPLSEINHYHSYSSQLEKQTELDQQMWRKHSKGKSTNDFLKEQLQSKKKSLIYLMYRRQEDQKSYQNIGNPKAKPNVIGINRKRSNSLSNLITTKCRQQIL